MYLVLSFYYAASNFNRYIIVQCINLLVNKRFKFVHLTCVYGVLQRR